MSDPVFSRDVHPITDFKVKSSAIVEKARRTKRPVLITQRGRGVAVVVGLEEYERMQEELEFGRAVDEGAAARTPGVRKRASDMPVSHLRPGTALGDASGAMRTTALIHLTGLMQETLDGLAAERRFPVVG